MYCRYPGHPPQGGDSSRGPEARQLPAAAHARHPGPALPPAHRLREERGPDPDL